MHVQVKNYVSHTHRKDLYRNLNHRQLAYFHCLKSEALEHPVKVSNRFLIWDFKPPRYHRQTVHLFPLLRPSLTMYIITAFNKYIN